MSLSSQDASFRQLVDEAFLLLEVANKLEEGGSDKSSRAQRLMEASAKYFEAVYFMKRLVIQLPATVPSSAPSKTKKLLLEKIEHYEKHAQSLLKSIGDAENNQNEFNAPYNPSYGNEDAKAQVLTSNSSFTSDENGEDVFTAKADLADNLLARAVDLDEQGRKSEAVSDYTTAAGHLLQAIQIIVHGEKDPKAEAGYALKRKLEGIMDRVEQLKKMPDTKEKQRPLQGKLVRAPSFQGYNVATF